MGCDVKTGKENTAKGFNPSAITDKYDDIKSDLAIGLSYLDSMNARNLTEDLFVVAFGVESHVSLETTAELKIKYMKMTKYHSATGSIQYAYKNLDPNIKYSNMYSSNVNNSTGFSYVDELKFSEALSSTLRVRYSGLATNTFGNVRSFDVSFIKSLETLFSSTVLNILAASKNGTQYTSTNTRDASTIITVDKLRDLIADAIVAVNDHEVASVRTSLKNVHSILKATGLDKQLKMTKYGGSISQSRLILRVPASRKLQEDLEDIPFGVPFSQLFTEEFVEHSRADVEGMSHKVYDLEDEYSTSQSSIDYEKINVDKLAKIYNKELGDNYYLVDYNLSGSNFGCKQINYRTVPVPSESTDIDPDWTPNYDANNQIISYNETYYLYRYFIPTQYFIENLDYLNASRFFWIAMDMKQVASKTCRWDEILTVIIIIVVTYFTCGFGSAAAGSALTTTQMMMIASAMIQIGLTTGAFGNGEGARNARIVSTLLSLGSVNYAAIGTATSAGMSAVLQILSTAMTVIETINNYDLQRKIEKEEKENAKKIELLSALNFEEEVAFTFDGMFRYSENNAFPNTDHHATEAYSEFSTYDTKEFGFING